MNVPARADDFDTRRAHLRGLSDDELHAYCWRLAAQIVQSLIDEARTHTSPSIERSVLLRMGFSSLEARALVNAMLERGLLAHGAGHIVLQVANKHGLSGRQAGLGLLAGQYWEEITVCA